MMLALDGLSDEAIAEIDAILNAPRPLPDAEYETDPLGWMEEVLGIPRATIDWALNDAYAGHKWDGTANPLKAVLDALANGESVGVESATTTGKTFLAACIVLWFLACFKNALVPTVAPKEDQLELHLWKEIGKLWPRFRAAYPVATKDHLRIRMVPGEDAWAAVGFVAGVSAQEVEGSATKAQGFHAEHMLIVFEETPGIKPAIMTAFKNTCRAPHNLRLGLGNPDNQHDELHKLCQSARVRHVIVSAYDHPNVVMDDPNFIPGAVSRQGLEDSVVDDGADSDIFKSRVRGISPSQSVYALIRQEWLDAAAARFEMNKDKAPPKSVKWALGVDVAQSEKGDRSAVSRWRGNTLVGLDVKPCPNATQLGRSTWLLATEMGCEPWHIGVDPIGVGAATVNALDELAANADAHQLGWAVQHLNAGYTPLSKASKAPDANLFLNLRGQMYWQLREDLRQGRIAIPKIPSLHRELTTPTFEIKSGKVVVESKDEIKKRIGKSPDAADAVVYGNWVRPRAGQKDKPPFDQDNQHPGFDYEKRTVRSITEEPDEPHAYRVPVSYKVPR
jgi:hypothetical protein